MEKILCETVTLAVECEKYHKMVLHYYLIAEDVGIGYCGLKSYGIEIEKTAIFDDGHTETERKSISNLFFRREDAKDFLKTLAKNQVTPISLKYVVEEYVEQTIRA